MGESVSSTGLTDLALLVQEQAREQYAQKYTDAGLMPLRCIYYSYLKEYGREPEDVIEMLKGFSFIQLSRSMYGGTNR